MVEILLGLAHSLVIGPGLRDGDHHRQRQIHAGHDKEFQRIVQLGGIRAGGLNAGQHLIEGILQIHTVHGLLPGEHLVCVAPDGIDLTVMYDITVGVGALPAGSGVGGETGVDHGDGRHILRIL